MMNKKRNMLHVLGLGAVFLVAATPAAAYYYSRVEVNSNGKNTVVVNDCIGEQEVWDMHKANPDVDGLIRERRMEMWMNIADDFDARGYDTRQLRSSVEQYGGDGKMSDIQHSFQELLRQKM